MELANNILTACFIMLQILIIRMCVKVFVMARFISQDLCFYLKLLLPFRFKTQYQKIIVKNQTVSII
jgi:hypothetical protein